MSDRMQLVVFMAAGLAAVLLFIAIIFSGSHLVNSKECAETANAMKLEHQYGFWNGCLVQLEDGQWVKLDSIRVQR